MITIAFPGKLSAEARMAVSFESISMPMRMSLNEDFLIKGIQKDENGDETAEFEGVVSTEHPDVEGDIIVQKGVDWNHFAKHGTFDWEHSKDAKDIIGVPLEVKTGIICKGQPATYVKGKLLLKQPQARDAYNLMKSLVGTGRQMGFSVLGKGMRDPVDRRKIVKSLFSRIAFTMTPVNPHTGGGLVDLVKSLDFAFSAPPTVCTQKITLPQLQALVRKSLGEIQGLDCDKFAATLFERAALDASASRP